MIIPPKYQLTHNISRLIASIEASKQVIDSLLIPKEIQTNIRRQSVLKSSLFSAKIEGNPLTLDDFIRTPSHDQKKLEVQNLLKAHNWIQNQKIKEISLRDILNLHQITMKGLIDNDNLGQIRNNMEAIFNSAGIVIYMPPPPDQIHDLMTKLLEFIGNRREEIIPIKATLAHYTFEKIHPFLDGSGRVGRLLIQLILTSHDYDMKGLLALEEYLDNHREEYYRLLEESPQDVTNYLEFMLIAIEQASSKAKNLILNKRKITPEDSLLPRRAEILTLIKEHKLMNLDQIKRRFLSISERTLRHDLKKLQDLGFIHKLGTTRGAYYTTSTNPLS